MRLSLVVLRAVDPATLVRFYERVGFSFVEERHDGPLHWSTAMQGAMLEIYPTKSPARMTFGIAVADPAAFRDRWIAAGGGSTRDTLRDPEGNVVVLSGSG